jgi:hypothetical protein
MGIDKKIPLVEQAAATFRRRIETNDFDSSSSFPVHQWFRLLALNHRCLIHSLSS